MLYMLNFQYFFRYVLLEIFFTFFIFFYFQLMVSAENGVVEKGILSKLKFFLACVHLLMKNAI